MLTSSKDNIPALVTAAKANPAAFGAVYDRFVSPVYRYLFSRVGNQADAEDLTAQTFLAALEALPKYNERGYFSAWLFSIAHSRVTDHFRRSRPGVELESAETRAGDADPLREVIQNEELRTLSNLLKNLTDDERELVRLRYVAGLSFAEMAALLRKNEDAVKKSLYRLLARMQSQLE